MTVVAKGGGSANIFSDVTLVSFYAFRHWVRAATTFSLLLRSGYGPPKIKYLNFKFLST